MSRVWDRFVPAQELDRLSEGGFGRPVALGGRPCLIVVDVVVSFLGSRPGEERDTGTPEYVTACGPAGWERLPAICQVIEKCRAADVPVVFTKGSPEDTGFVGGAIKLLDDLALARHVDEAPFPSEILPAADEYVLTKTRASAFFHTSLELYLRRERIDSLIVVGTTTSGCVRATAVDGSSYGYPVLVVEDACFDRSEFAHASNLFDIQMKYGEVVDMEGLGRALSRGGIH